MYNKIHKIIFILLLLYQTPLYSKSNSSNYFNVKDFSNYFSGIVAFENKDNSEALKYFNFSKDLLDQHSSYLKRYITTLVLEKKVPQAISVIKDIEYKENINFFDAYLLLILDNLKNNEVEKAYENLEIAFSLDQRDKFKIAILETLKEFIIVFDKKKLLEEKKNFGNFSFIAETFQRCYLDDVKTGSYFVNLINKDEADYSRYTYFYLTYLVDKKKFDEIDKLILNINYLNSTLLLSQAKDWIENKNFEKFERVFSCKNPTHIISEFLFLISNLYSSQDNFERSNFYLYLSNFLNPKFIYNTSLMAENYYLNEDYKKSKKVLRNFKEEDNFYYWYRIRKEAQIITKQKNREASLIYISSEFKKIEKPNYKMIFDLANYNKNSGDYETAIKYYSIVIENLSENSNIKSDLLYRRGGTYERIGDYVNADKDLLHSLVIDPDDTYVLNYLAYSWLERNYKIDEAIKMLETAYANNSDDPYIIDSIGWAYYLVNDYLKAEKFIRRAVELMPDDPIVNDHYGDILWKLNQKIQARYFWKNILKMENVEENIIESIKEKLIYGPKIHKS